MLRVEAVPLPFFEQASYEMRLPVPFWEEVSHEMRFWEIARPRNAVFSTKCVSGADVRVIGRIMVGSVLKRPDVFWSCCLHPCHHCVLCFMVYSCCANFVAGAMLSGRVLSLDLDLNRKVAFVRCHRCATKILYDVL